MLDDIDYTAPTRQHELDHTDHTRSGIDLPCMADLDHQVGIYDMSEVRFFVFLPWIWNYFSRLVCNSYLLAVLHIDCLSDGRHDIVMCSMRLNVDHSS